VTILITGYAEEMSDLISQTLGENAYACLTKPLDMFELLKFLREVAVSQKNGTTVKPRARE
jgi:hypothetical protein